MFGASKSDGLPLLPRPAVKRSDLWKTCHIQIRWSLHAINECEAVDDRVKLTKNDTTKEAYCEQLYDVRLLPLKNNSPTYRGDHDEPIL